MKFWEKANDALHDITRAFGNTGNHNARAVDNAQPAGVTGQALRTRERGILDRNVVEQAQDYAKVSHSPSVQSLMRHIDNHTATMTRMRIPQRREGNNADQTFLNELAQVNGEVFACMQEMQDYLMRKAQGYADKTQRYKGVMDACIMAATKIRTQMELIKKIQENCFYAVRNGRDVPYGESYENLLQHVDIFQETEETERTFLGQGGINSVFLVDDEERHVQRVLKEGQAKVTLQDGKGEKAVYERIRMQNMQAGQVVTMNTAYRDVAVSMIDKLFGLSAVVDTSLVRSRNGKQSSLMDKAEGKEVGKTYSYMDQRGLAHASLLQQILINEQYLKNGLDYKLSDDEQKEKESHEKTQLVNINSAQFLESTYNLAALDIIVGHVDRHIDNIMMTENGVKGIDNDSAFSLRSEKEVFEGATRDMTMSQIVNMQNENDAEVRGAQAFLYFNKAFPVVTEQFRQKILGVSEAAVRGTLKGLIPDDEIEACVNRVRMLQNYLRSMGDDKIVGSFDEVDRNAYSSESRLDLRDKVSTNIMSQVRANGGAVYLENEDRIKEMQLSGSPEMQAIMGYVTRMRGLYDTDSEKIACMLMSELAHTAEQEYGFDLRLALEDGTMVRLYDKVMRATNAIEK